jgi:hypothetical protein
MGNRHTPWLSGRVGLVHADENVHAARQLRSRVPGIEWVDLATADAATDLPVVELVNDPSRVEGSFSITRAASEGAPRIAVVGDRFSGVIYGANELADRLASAPWVLQPGAAIEQQPGLAYRTFWNWDHSTNWELSQVGHQEIGVFNPWSKPPRGFERDFERVVDFMSLNRISAVVIYGFLRDSHGGIEAAQELCRYAKERGVRILPGIAIGAYGGAYWEGNSRFNLSTWLDENPQFAADMGGGIGFQLEDLAFPLSFPRSDYTRSACPSASETMDWMTDAVTWLAENFEIGGINIESGDYGVCGCGRCQKRRGGREHAARRDGAAESWSHADMADNFPRLFEAAKSVNEDLWMYCELQWDNLLDPEAHAPLMMLPQGGIYQHTMNKSYWNKAKGQLTRDLVEGLPTQPNVLRCQFACQWNGDERTERYTDNSRVFVEMSKAAYDSGMQGLTVWGEPSPFHTGAELSYLAFARFGYDPGLSWDAFVRRDIAPLLGGQDMSHAYLEIMGEMDKHQALPVDRLDALLSQAREATRQLNGDAYRRWQYLANRLLQRKYMGQ